MHVIAHTFYSLGERAVDERIREPDADRKFPDRKPMHRDRARQIYQRVERNRCNRHDTRRSRSYYYYCTSHFSINRVDKRPRLKRVTRARVWCERKTRVYIFDLFRYTKRIKTNGGGRERIAIGPSPPLTFSNGRRRTLLQTRSSPHTPDAQPVFRPHNIQITKKPCYDNASPAFRAICT